MRAKVKQILSACWTALITLIMPGAIQDETTKASEHIPTDVFRPRNYPGEVLPEDNPWLNDPHNVHRRMKWDQEHGWADYS